MTHEFKPGDKALLDGREVTVIGVTSDGRYAWERDNGDACGFARDLLPPAPPEPEKVVRWVNLYRMRDGRLLPGCLQSSISDAKSSGSEVIARSRLTLTPGVFEDENTPDPYTKGWNEALGAVCDRLALTAAEQAHLSLMRRRS
jgi:hypothetical protein